MQKPGLSGDNLLRRHFYLDGFRADFLHAAKLVIIIRFCNTVAGTSADNAHAVRTALAVSDLGDPFLESALLSHHRCFWFYKLYRQQKCCKILSS